MVDSHEARRGLCASISARLHQFVDDGDELRVLDAVLMGLELGRHQYGPLDTRDRARNWRHEANQEFRDARIYLACVELSEHADRLRELDINTAVEEIKAAVTEDNQ